MKHDIYDIIEVLSESTTDSIYDDYDLDHYTTEGVITEIILPITTVVGLVYFFALISIIYEKAKHSKSFKLTDKNLSTYKSILEKYAKENKLINPKEIQIKKITSQLFKSIKNQDKLVYHIAKQYDFGDYTEDDIKTKSKYVLKSDLLNKDDNYNANKIIDEIKHVYSNDDGLFYNNKLICIIDKRHKLNMIDTDISIDYCSMVYSYHTGIFNSIKELKKIDKYFTGKYPEDKNMAKELLKNIKNKKKGD